MTDYTFLDSLATCADPIKYNQIIKKASVPQLLNLVNILNYIDSCPRKALHTEEEIVLKASFLNRHQHVRSTVAIVLQTRYTSTLNECLRSGYEGIQSA